MIKLMKVLFLADSDMDLPFLNMRFLKIALPIYPDFSHDLTILRTFSSTCLLTLADD